KRRARGVEFDAHFVHARLHNFTQLAAKPRLEHIVLILAYSDTLGIQLDELSEWILQAPCDADRSAHSKIQIRKLLARYVAGRVNAGARFAHRNTERLRPWSFEARILEKFLDECL